MNFDKLTFKDFENIPELDLNDRSKIFKKYLTHMGFDDFQSYRIVGKSGCNANMTLESKHGDSFISFVSNDYLGFTQHPKVKQTAIEGIERYGTGAGASPLIGGFFDYHRLLEKKIAAFFGRQEDCSVIYTTGYTANSASLQSLLQKEDIAIVDMAVHTSVHEGCILTNKKTFLHNDTESLERILQNTVDKYRTRMVIVDGVYSQDGDVAPLKEIVALCKKYGAYVMVDDAHGVGVIGKTGRGALEEAGLLEEVDFITGTFSKTFGAIGGYVICSAENAAFLKFQSRQQIFSATAGPVSLGIVKAIELIDEEPQWQEKLRQNMAHFRSGLLDIGIDIGTTSSAIFPLKLKDPHLTVAMNKAIFKKGIYANAILYPAVSKKDARVRMSLSALHTTEQLNTALSVIESVFLNEKQFV
ncbi:aminotransferase class I/II-fold pyridoxal phosphate-dependent enzyme [Sphingobacterium shayense]|uniref:aminotransferase class I/II-fold pyridoxal phosphate-dependent enzyme n=1 Tax=Sphingobacterium shayense TaxID=626343 RepID=UPI0015547FB4|nr:aminotransferase class I/II-fold pyridoxal phosphate-dependent enzyme [Sphingobacterium shayense]NQD69782.1 aminotransferase class I/II-fold pyridoxal phosphate-dependent enzyme [Sphingobacterium shayense]